MAAVRDHFKYSGGQAANDPAWRVVIAPGPSRRAAAWIVAVAAASLAAALGPQAPGAVKAVVACAIGIAAVHSCLRHGFGRGAGVVRRVSVDLPGRVQVAFADGRHLSGRLADDSFVAPWLTVVRWVPDGARLSRAIVIVPDSVDTEAFRRLRVLLRWR